MSADAKPARTLDPKMTLAESLSLASIPISIAAPGVLGMILGHGEIATTVLGVVSSVLIFALAVRIKRHFSFKLKSEHPAAD